MNRKEQGITLIALVITIIVLLILAGVSISIVIGDNGILSKAVDASDKTKSASIIEDVELAWDAITTEYYADKYTNNSTKITMDTYFTAAKLNEELEIGTILDMEYSSKDNSTIIYQVTSTGEKYVMTVNKKGEVIGKDDTDKSTIASLSNSDADND
jgi:hypothetical protein